MANEAIELVQNWKPERAEWPAYFSEKLDGVPLRFLLSSNGRYVALTRQHEHAQGVQHIYALLPWIIKKVGGSITGEMHIEGKPFKEISGLVRDKYEHPELVLRVFDADLDADPKAAYVDRLEACRAALADLAGLLGKAISDLPIRLIEGVVVHSPAEAEDQFRLLMQTKPNAEGAVLHYLFKEYTPGKRLYHTQRMKPTPTIDLKIVAFEQAVGADTGEPLGMVGRIIAEFNTLVPARNAANIDGTNENTQPVLVTQRIGIGPGALKHKERTALWVQAKIGKYTPRIAEIKYMRDDTYDALRQPTFVRWRDDKTEPDTYA